MLDTLFSGLFDTDMTSVITVSDFLLCVGCSLVIGLLFAAMYMFRTRYTKSFVVTLALLPAVVCVVIMMVNGNVGTGVAVAGAFSLVRFRSVPGTAKEIGILFLAMGAGLIAGMGYLGYAFLFSFSAASACCTATWTLAPKRRRCCTKPCTSPSRRIWTIPACLTAFLRITPPPGSLCR